MTKVPSLGYDQVVRALQRDGWVVVRQKGRFNYRDLGPKQCATFTAYIKQLVKKSYKKIASSKIKRHLRCR
jgi:hypothetical protein